MITIYDSLWASWFNIEVLHDKDIWSWTPHLKDSKLLKTIGKIKNKILRSCNFSTELANNTIGKWYHCKGLHLEALHPSKALFLLLDGY